MALPNKAKIPVGTVLAGKYRVTREIGRGGMAAVYEAANVDIGKRVAIKVLAQELTASAVVVERFLREARAAAAIRSPYICDIYDSGRLEDGRPFLVLELLEGESLYERMTKIRWLDIETTVSIVTQTCRGLTKAHAAQIVHRDLKPENIFLTKDEEGKLLAKILDFGLAKFYAPMEAGGGPQARLTREGAVFGTPAYMSPEQVRGQGAVDHRADLWALGCIVYECFTGRTVWSTEQGVAMTFAQIANAPLPRPSVYRPDLPEGFTAWFDRALDRDINKRFQTAKEFADGLAEVLHPDRRISDTPSQSRPAKQLVVSMASQPGAPSAPSMPSTPHPLQPTAPAPQPPSQSLPADQLAARVSSGANRVAPTPQPGPVAPQSASPSKMGFVAPGPQGAREGTDTQLPPKRRSNTLRNVAFVAAGAAVTIAIGLVAWTQLGSDPPVRLGTSASGSATASAPPPPASASTGASSTATAAPSGRPEAPAPPWMTPVRDAQQAIASGDLKAANKLLKDAFDRAAGHGVPRTMMEHLAVASAGGGTCRLSGLARPRSYDLATSSMKPLPAGRPSIAVTPKGAVITWTDAHEGAEHAYVAALDDALRSTGAPVDVTPDGLNVGRPELKRIGDKLVLAWGDAKGPEAGVHARFLDAEGKPAGAPVAVTPPRPGTYWPSLAAAPDGTIFVAWADEGDSDSDDLFLRRLSPTLEPAPELVRATDLIASGPAKARVRAPVIAVAGDSLLAAYRMEREPLRLIHELRVRVADAGKGLDAAKKGDRRADRNIGEVVLINTDKAKSDAPTIACGPAACYLAWHGEGAGGGASAAYLEPARSQPIWRRKFSRTGTRPAVAVSPTTGQAQVVWFEGGRILTASITRDGVGQPTKIARISGDQPTPSIVAGNRPGEWYVAWLDYETGHLEAYAARVQCK